MYKREKERSGNEVKILLSLSLSPEVYSCPISHANDKLFNENELGNTIEVCFDYLKQKLYGTRLLFYLQARLLKSQKLRAF